MRIAGTKLAANHQYRGFGDQLYDLSGQRPSLDLNFSSNKSLIDSASGQNLVTFTRASSGTYVGSDGLIKTATTNLLLRSEEFDNANWARNATTVSVNVTTAPNGTVTADKLIEDLTNDFHVIAQYVAGFASGAVLTLSIYAKAAGRSLFRIQTDSSAGFGFADFNLSAVTATSGAGVFTAGSIQAVGDGWYRCSVRCTTSTAGAVGLKVILFTTTVGPYTGDGTSGLFLWGAQLEQSSTVGEYIPTTSTINSAPRFDHNPTTGESLGLLVEEQRTNLALQSENFGTTWTPSGLLAFGSGSTLNAAAAPDGASTADLITEDTATSTHLTTQGSLSFTSGTTYTVSCFVKRGTGSRNAAIVLRAAAFSGAPRVSIDLSTGATTLTGSGGTTGSQAYPNGWWRVFLTATATATTTSFVDIGLVSGASTLSYTGDGTSGIYIWGAQLEAGSFPTSYIPTTTATVTRSADVASISGSNFSSWYWQDEGTVFAEINRNTSISSNLRAFTVTDGTLNNRIFDLRQDTSSLGYAFSVASGITEALQAVGLNSGSQNNKVAISQSLNNFGVSANGGSVLADTSVTMPVVNRISIGSLDGATQFGGTIRRLTYWPQRLPNETLQTITQ